MQPFRVKFNQPSERRVLQREGFETDFLKPTGASTTISGDPAKLGSTRVIKTDLTISNKAQQESQLIHIGRKPNSVSSQFWALCKGILYLVYGQDRISLCKYNHLSQYRRTETHTILANQHLSSTAVHRNRPALLPVPANSQHRRLDQLLLVVPMLGHLSLLARIALSFPGNLGNRHLVHLSLALPL